MSDYSYLAYIEMSLLPGGDGGEVEKRTEEEMEEKQRRRMSEDGYLAYVETSLSSGPSYSQARAFRLLGNHLMMCRTHPPVSWARSL